MIRDLALYDIHRFPVETHGHTYDVQAVEFYVPLENLDNDMSSVDDFLVRLHDLADEVFMTVAVEHVDGYQRLRWYTPRYDNPKGGQRAVFEVWFTGDHNLLLMKLSGYTGQLVTDRKVHLSLKGYRE